MSQLSFLDTFLDMLMCSHLSACGLLSQIAVEESVCGRYQEALVMPMFKNAKSTLKLSLHGWFYSSFSVILGADAFLNQFRSNQTY